MSRKTAKLSTDDSVEVQPASNTTNPSPTEPIVPKAEAPTDPRYRALKQGPTTHFWEGYKPPGFDETYGGEAPEDLIEITKKHFREDDNFMFLFNVRDNYKFTIIVPFKFSNLDEITKSVYRVDARTRLLKAGTEAEQVEDFCKAVVEHLKYNKNR